jgi:hypothetical protein
VLQFHWQTKWQFHKPRDPFFYVRLQPFPLKRLDNPFSGEVANL